MQVTWKNHLQSLLLLKNFGTSSLFIYKCKQEMIPFFFLLVRLYRWTITVVLALMQSWAWTFITLERKNQENLIAGNPGETRCEGQFCGISLLQIYTANDNLKCCRYPLILLVAELGQGGIKLARKSQTQNSFVLLVWVWFGFFSLYWEINKAGFGSHVIVIQYF